MSPLYPVVLISQSNIRSNAEYQVLYVPLRAPLSEEEKMDRKVVQGRRITGNLPLSTGFEQLN